MADSRLEPLVLTGDERRTLENWVRRRRTAQGLALRARIVLACAQGGSNTAVAAPLGVSRTTVRKWRAPFPARPPGGPPATPPPRGRDARVEGGAGRAEGDLADGGAPHLGGMGAAALGARALQVPPGPAADRQDPRRGGPVPGPAGERGSLQRGRKAADPGPGADRPGIADDARGARAAQLRLRPPRHNRPVRPAPHRHPQRHHPPLPPPPPPRLPP